MLIIDTKKPNKDPFEIDSEGTLKKLNQLHPGRFKAVGGQVRVMPEDVIVIPDLPKLEDKGTKEKVRRNRKPTNG